MTVHQLMQAILDAGMDTDQICDLMKLKPKRLLEAFPRSMWDNTSDFYEALGIVDEKQAMPTSVEDDDEEDEDEEEHGQEESEEERLTEEPNSEGTV